MVTKTGLGARVEMARKGKHWSQDDLAAATGIGVATVRRVELGTFDPRLGTLRRLADELGVSLQWVLTDDDTTGDGDAG